MERRDEGESRALEAVASGEPRALEAGEPGEPRAFEVLVPGEPRLSRPAEPVFAAALASFVGPRMLRSASPRSSALDLVWATVRQRRALLVGSLLARGVWEVSPFLQPMLLGAIVDLLAEARRAEAAAVEAGLAWAVLGLFGLGLVQAASARAYAECTARLGLGTMTRLRTALMDRLLASDGPDLSVGDKIVRASRDIDRVRGFVDRLFVRGVTTIARVLVPGALLLQLHPGLAAVALVVLPVQQGVAHLLQMRLQAASRSSSEAQAHLVDALGRALDSNAGKARTAHAEELAGHAAAVEAAELRSARLVAGVRAVVWLGSSLGVALAWWLGSRAVLSGDLTPGGLVTFGGYVVLFYQPFRQLTNVTKTYRAGLASLERIAEVIHPPVDRLEVSARAPVDTSAHPASRIFAPVPSTKRSRASDQPRQATRVRR